MTDPSNLRERVRAIEESRGYGDDTPEELYLRMLRDAEPQCPDSFPGAGEEFIRRYRRHVQRSRQRQARRAKRYGVDREESAQ